MIRRIAATVLLAACVVLVSIGAGSTIPIASPPKDDPGHGFIKPDHPRGYFAHLKELAR